MTDLARIGRDGRAYPEPEPVRPVLVGHSGAVWYGGVGHRLLTLDGDGPPYGVTCYRCGMAAEPGCAERLIPDCAGPIGTAHHWTPNGRDGIECAYYCPAEILADGTATPAVSAECPRA